MKKLLFPVLLMCMSLMMNAQPASTRVLESPDANLKMTFMLTADGTPQYALDYGEYEIILPSNLGFELRGDLASHKHVYHEDGRITRADENPSASLHDGFEMVGEETVSFDETWEPVWGEESRIRNNYNELLVKLVQASSGREMWIRFRLYNDGLGFRYEFPYQKDFYCFIIKEELSQFALTGDHTAWWIPGDYDTQEYFYTKSRLSEISSRMKSAIRAYDWNTPFSVNGVQTSLQMVTDNGIYINIHEAALVDYPCMHLELNPETLTFVSHLTPDAQGWKGFMQTPSKTPWRTVQVAPDATSQLASRLILNLNDPCVYEDTDWIRPVKYMGVWWEMISRNTTWEYTNDYSIIDLNTIDYTKTTPNGRHAATTENVRHYIDFAAEHGFDQVLVEGWNVGWEDQWAKNKDYVFDFVTPYPDFDLVGLNEYAHSKGVRLMMHHETCGAVRNYERHMDKAFDLMEKYGYNAIKSGYVGPIIPVGENHFSQPLVNHYLYAVKKAGERGFVVNAHEAIRPTGLCRTYPNLIGNESAIGTEYQSFGGIPPEHVTILPFTRLNGGPMDYTPGLFEMDLSKLTGGRNKSRAMSTIANQLALYLTMYSPLQMAADTPKQYNRFPDAFQFIKDVDIDWIQTKYLSAEPGDYFVVARQGKKNGQWFCGGVTDENERTMKVSLDFLEKGKKYMATIYRDADDAHYLDNPQAYMIEKKKVTSRTVLPVTMAAGGGFAISFEELQSTVSFAQPESSLRPDETVLLYGKELADNVDPVVGKRILAAGFDMKEDNGLTGPETMGDYGDLYNTNVNARVDLYFPEKPNGQMIVVCPGGGYYMVGTYYEGLYIAEWMLSHGITVAVVKYRLPNGHWEVPLADVQNAFRYCRAHAQEWGISQIGVIGCSAGGQLAASVSTLFVDDATRPDFSILIYPVITMEKGVTDPGTHDRLIGEESIWDDKKQYESLMYRFSLENQVTDRTPPTFMAHSGNDTIVPVENTLRYYAKLVEHNVPAEVHIYQTGNHGWGFLPFHLIGKEDNGDRFRYGRDNFYNSMSLWLESLR